MAVNLSVPILYPKLKRKYGDVVTYEENPLAHVKTEFGFACAAGAAWRSPASSRSTPSAPKPPTAWSRPWPPPPKLARRDCAWSSLYFDELGRLKLILVGDLAAVSRPSPWSSCWARGE